jgi:predicted ABC-type transport system involved in lysophospholipase L1 biosynthesis ATPase subunit
VTHDQNLGDRAKRHIRMVDGQVNGDEIRPNAPE